MGISWESGRLGTLPAPHPCSSLSSLWEEKKVSSLVPATSFRKRHLGLPGRMIKELPSRPQVLGSGQPPVNIYLHSSPDSLSSAKVLNETRCF